MKIIASIGVSGSGKSTYLKERYGKDFYISSDDIRGVFGDVNSQERNRDVFVVYEYLIRYFASFKDKLPQNIICDSTNYSRKNRKLIISLAQELGLEIEWVFFNVPSEECKSRNSRRERKVPDFVIDKQSNGLTMPDDKEMGEVPYTITEIEHESV